MKILLIDDHKLFSQSIKMILELSENIKKVQLVDNFSTISEIAFNDYDIILIDINLTSLYQDDGLTLSQTSSMVKPFLTSSSISISRGVSTSTITSSEKTLPPK